MSFEERPLLVFWETTRACGLACLHCRASAMPWSMPGELTSAEGTRLIDQVASFGRPSPVLVFTGGDPLRRHDLFGLFQHARERSVPFAIAPAVTDLLDPLQLERLAKSGATSISISLDGATASTHDSIRGVPGSFDRTLGAIGRLLDLGVRVQVNTTVMRRNYRELPHLFHALREARASVWEVFFLVQTGRGAAVDDLTPSEWENVGNFLVEASRYGLPIRGIEAPFVRRILHQRRQGRDSWYGQDSLELCRTLHALEGESARESSLRPTGTLDGDGTIFVAHDGTIQPGGLLPLPLGRAPGDDLVSVYRTHPVLRGIRERRLNGSCGVCPYRRVCGGSRARAFAYSGDPLGQDPACEFGRAIETAGVRPIPASA